MKYNSLQIIMLITCCMWCVTSCSSDSAYEPEADESVEMSFDVAPDSRAATTLINEFSVYGDRKLQSDALDPIVIFNKTSVVNSDGTWRYDDIQHWYSKHEHSFVAVSPSAALESDASPQYNGSGLSFAFTMPAYSGKEMQNTQDKTDLYDVVAATHRRLFEKGDVVNAISLRFGHLLSMVNFAPKLDDKSIKGDDYIQFHKLEISGLKTKAKISVTPAQLSGNRQTNNRLIEFTGHDGNDKLTITFTEPKIIKNGQQLNLFADNDALIMLPQSFEASSGATVRFTYSFKDDPDNLKQGSISLTGQEWKTGTVYNYNFTVDKIGLNLGTATIKTWDSQIVPDINWKVE
ncbi:MAG: fimbrillin family protein [Muribaculaceae bacterium]|nr:fimbrillin family protein [Muribaculaceae bacterium]